MADDVLEDLVAAFSRDETQLKRISSSRLFRWMLDQGGTPEMWPRFVERLLDWGLWDAWDVGEHRLEHQTERVRASYRDAARETRAITIHPKRLNALGSGATALALLGWAAAIVGFEVWHQLFHFGFFGLPMLVLSGTHVVRFLRPDRLELDRAALRVVRHGRTIAEISREEIAWVDVVSGGDPEVSAALKAQKGAIWRMLLLTSTHQARVVVAQLKNGDVVPLTDNVDETTARATCEMLEDELDLVPKRGAKIRVELDDDAAERMSFDELEEEAGERADEASAIP